VPCLWVRKAISLRHMKSHTPYQLRATALTSFFTMITHEDLDGLRLFLKGKPARDVLEERFQNLHRKIEDVPVVPDPEEQVVAIPIGADTMNFVRCCDTMIIHINEGNLRGARGLAEAIAIVTQKAGLVRMVYCPWCGTKINIK
jgi:hypothetical protein